MSAAPWPDTAQMRRVAERLEGGLITGEHWPNTREERTRLQAAQLLREAADQIDDHAAFARDLSQALNSGDGSYRP